MNYFIMLGNCYLPRVRVNSIPNVILHPNYSLMTTPPCKHTSSYYLLVPLYIEKQTI